MFILDPAGSRDYISTWLAVAATKSADAQVTNPDQTCVRDRPDRNVVLKGKKEAISVSYTHLTLPTNREV